MAKAKSKKSESKKPAWLKYTKEEIKAIILKLTNKGLTAEKIGLTLRDQYGIPSVKLYNIKIKEVMGEKFSEPSVINLKNKLEKIIKHFEKNKQDTTAGRSLIVIKSKLKKRTNYHKL